MAYSHTRTNRFNQGTGCFTCSRCGKKTRDTGDNGDSGMCPVCFQKIACGNSLSDSGYAEASGGKDPWGVFEDCKTQKQVYATMRREAAKYGVTL